jgi:hypothetical protein
MKGVALKEPQNMRALGMANEIRLARADVKRRIKDGKESLRDVLTAPPACLERMALEELLRSGRRVGRAKAQRICGRASISPRRQVGALTERQRLVLVDCLPGHLA